MEGGAINRYALGRIVAGEEGAARYIFFKRLNAEHQCSLRIHMHDAIASHEAEATRA